VQDNGAGGRRRGVIASANLEALIDGQLSRATRGQLTVDELVELVDFDRLAGTRPRSHC